MYNYWNIEIDGIDRVGKDTLAPYFTYLSNYRFAIKPRGLLTQLVYAEKYNRKYEYDYETYKEHTIIILLSADEIDLQERFWATHEKPIDIKEDMNLFNKYATKLSKEGFNVLRYNTSHTTHFDIATKVIQYIDMLESYAQGVENNG